MEPADVDDKGTYTSHGEAGQRESGKERSAPPDLPFVDPAVPDDAGGDMLAAFLPTMKPKERRAYYRLRATARRIEATHDAGETALAWILEDAGLSSRRAWDIVDVVDSHLPGLLTSDDLAGLLLSWRRKGTGRTGGQAMLPGLDGPGLPDTRPRQ
jgi:hypothetical protein